MNKTTPIIHTLSALYLWLVGLCIGAMVACGAFVAPIIFNAYTYLPDVSITQYDSGILMTQVFLKLNWLLNFSAIMIIIYELLDFKASFRPSFFLLGLNILNVILIFIFTLYYTPHILSAQNMGAAYTATPEFENLHSQSEFLFKILLVTLSISFLWRIITMKIKKSDSNDQKRSVKKKA